MSLQHTRILSKVFNRGYIKGFNGFQSFRFNTSASDDDNQPSGAPYRPFPFDQYYKPKSADYWSKNGYKPTSEAADQYPKEELYLDEIEERLRKYDKKYSKADEIKNLWNEYALEHSDDKAFAVYGGGLSTSQDDVSAFGRGKKLDPSLYINGDYAAINRKPIPPLQFLTKEQVRRTRGSMASVREVPPETESIFKFWNGYTCLGVFFVSLAAKEWIVMFHHDMFDAILLWSIFGFLGSLSGDFFAWWHAISFQEHYDRKFFLLTKTVKDINTKLEQLKTKPNERKLLQQLLLYRNSLSERVLQKTLGNRLQRIIDNTLKKLDSKVQEEATIKASVESTFKKEALERTEDYFTNDSIKSAFTDEALRQFTSGDTAKLDKNKILVQMESTVFQDEYAKNLDIAKTNYINEQNNKGTLNWVFKSDNERSSQYMSSSQKESEYNKKLQEWESSRNSVNAPMPAFT